MICVDASVAVKWILDEDYAAQARLLLGAAVNQPEPMIAPTLLAGEVANTLRQRQRRGLATLAEARSLLADFLGLPVALYAPVEMYDRALVLADEYGLAAAYDACYVALAEAFGAIFWTADERLLRALRGRLSFVRWIGDYPV